MSRLPERFHCIVLSIHCKWFVPEYYLGVFTVSYWKPQNALYLFLFLFKANGSESEQSAVTQAEIHDDLENTQMEKDCFCQPDGMAVHTHWAQNATSRCLHPQELESLLMNNHRNWGAGPGLGPVKVMDPQRQDLGKGQVQAFCLHLSLLPWFYLSVSFHQARRRALLRAHQEPIPILSCLHAFAHFVPSVQKCPSSSIFQVIGDVSQWFLNRTLKTGKHGFTFWLHFPVAGT